MYCQKCWYDLQRSESGTCPECGRGFDPDDPRTHDPFRPRRVAGVVALLAAIPVVALVQLVVVAGRELVVDWSVLLDAPGIAAFLAGAFASGWYARGRRLGLAAYGLVGAACVAAMAFQSEDVREWSWLAKGAGLLVAWAGAAVGAGAANVTGWRVRRRWHRFRAAHALPWLPRRRTVVMTAIGAVAVVMAWVTFESWRVANGEPAPAVDYHAQLDRLRAELTGADTDHAGWPELQRIAAEADRILYDAGFNDPPDRRLTALIEEVTLPDDADIARAAVAALQGAGIFDTLRRHAGGPIACRIPPDSTSMIGASRVLRFIDGVALARVASMRLAAEDGDFDEVVRATDELIGLARTFSHQGSALDLIVGSIIVVRTTRELARELDEKPFPAETCRALLAALDADALASPELMMEEERLRTYDDLQRHYTEGGAGYAIPGQAMLIGRPVARLPANRAVALLVGFQSRFVQASGREEAALADAFADLGVREARRPPWERWADREELVALQMIDRRYAMAATFPPRPLAHLRRHTDALLAIEAARALVAIELFTIENARPPATLDDLVPAVLPAVPIDQHTGRPLIYRLVPDDADGPGFVLYSAGGNRTDDGGTFDPVEPRKARRPGTGGLDVPFVIPRRTPSSRSK